MNSINSKISQQRIDQELTLKLNTLLPSVLEKTGFSSVHSLNAKIGGKHRIYCDIRNAVVYSAEQFIGLWLDGFKKVISGFEINSQFDRSEYITYLLLKEHKIFQDYLYLFLKRTFIRYFDSLTKKKPSTEESIIWIGQNNANYGLLITPRFMENQWTNDNSEIRHFKHKYWSIGHVLETGLCIPGEHEKITFINVKDYLNFFKNVLVRNSGSKYEYEIAQQYCSFVESHNNPKDVPLLIPEYRYGGVNQKHKYRLDFTIIESTDLNKFGFELSPWSSHGHISKTLLVVASATTCHHIERPLKYLINTPVQVCQSNLVEVGRRWNPE